MSKGKIYKENPKSKQISESTFMKAGTTTEIEIAGKKFKIMGPKDTIEIQRIIKSQSVLINKLENENITIRRTVGKLQAEVQELKNAIAKINSRYFGDEV